MNPTPAPRTGSPRLRVLALAIVAPVAVALTLVLSAPLWIDAPAVRARIAALADDLSGGRARWDALELHYLPRPAATLRQVSFALPPRMAVEARTLTVELELLPLLGGQVHPHRIVVGSPRVRVQLPPPDPATPPPTVARVRALLRGTLDTLFERAPSASVQLEDGTLDLITAAGTPLRFTGLALQGRVAEGRLEASAAASSPLFDRLALEARIRRADLEGAGRMKLSGLHLGALAALLPPGTIALDPADATAELAWRVAAPETLTANLNVTAPTLAARRGTGQLDAAGLVLEAQAGLRGEALELAVSRAALARPHLDARGRLSFAPGAGWHAVLEEVRADPGELQAAAARFLPDVAMLGKPPVHVAAGSVATVTLEAAGATLADLATLPALRGEARLESITLAVPAAGLEVHGVGAHATLEGGTLRVERLAARTLAGDVTGGTLSLQLDARPVTLQGAATAHLHLAGAATLVRRLLDPAGSAYRELTRVHDLQGDAQVRVTLAGDARRPLQRVEVSALRATGRHELLPLPIAITGGAATLEGRRLSVRGLSGNLGRSTIRDVNVRMQLGAAARLESASGSAEIDLAEVLRVARARPEVAGRLEGVRAATGALAVQLDRAAGALADPRAIDYAVRAAPRQVSLDLAALGPALALDGGEATLTPGMVAARGVGAVLLDGALQVGGRMPIGRRRDAVPQVTASGTLGPRVLEWIQARAALPEAARLRDPVTLDNVVLDWPGGGDFATRGGVQIAGGPALSFDVGRAGRRIDVRSLTLKDATSDCSLAGSLEGSRFTAHFAGHLAGRSLAGPLRRPDIDAARLGGDLHVTGDWTNAGHGKANGFLEASRIPLPARLGEPLLIERARVDAAGSRIRIPQAVLVQGTSRLAVDGSVDRSERTFRVDARIRGEVLELPRRTSAPAEAAAPPVEAARPATTDTTSPWERLFSALEKVPVAGRVQVDLGRLRAGTLEIAPLQASAVLEERRLQVDIGKAALCAIVLSGSFSARRGAVGASGTLSARGAPLETTLPCLTNGRLHFAGRLDLEGTFSAQGAPEALAESFRANFRAVSRDGRINRFDALARLLRLVNVTEVARGAITDLGSAGMAYRSASVTGSVKGRMVRIEEGILDAEGIKIVAEGTVDYGNGALAANVLAAPMQTVNWLVDRIPLVRRIFGGTVLAIPARVSGTVRDPVVVPLGARAVGSRMVDLLANTVRLPADLVKTLEPAAGKADEGSAKPKAGQ